MSEVGQVISAGAGLLNDHFNRKYNAREAERNREFQREEREAAQQFNIDMWNMNNEYNSLSSQVDRAVDAGFSPNAILEGGSQESSMVQTSPMAGAQSSFQSSMSPVLAGLSKTLAETDLIKQQARGQALSNSFDAQSMESRLKLIDKNVEGISTTIKKDLAEIGKTDIETKTLKKAFEYFADFQDVELDVRLAELNKLRNENLKVVEEIKNTKKQGTLLDKQAQIADEQIESLSQDNELKSLEVEISQVTGIPVGTPESDAVLYMWATGSLPDYVRDVRTPLERSSWRPTDYAVPSGLYDFGFDPSKGVKSPSRVFDDYEVAKTLQETYDIQLPRIRGRGFGRAIR